MSCSRVQLLPLIWYMISLFWGFPTCLHWDHFTWDPDLEWYKSAPRGVFLPGFSCCGSQWQQLTESFGLDAGAIRSTSIMQKTKWVQKAAVVQQANCESVRLGDIQGSKSPSIYHHWDILTPELECKCSGSSICENSETDHTEITPSILTPLVNLQVSSPSSGWAEDLGCDKEERQRQPPQCHPHEGVLLLPQSPMHLLWAARVSTLTYSLHASKHACMFRS